jgi:hypothetical protein
MQISEVVSSAERKEFHLFPKILYRTDPNWICPLDSAVEEIFDPTKNQKFKNGDAIRWILRDENNETIGRVAAFVDYKRSAASRQPTGGIGFFEVIEDKDAAFTLFDTAKAWLAGRGMEAMDGPINFGENISDWGLLVDGFTQQGFGMPYNKKYYRDFFEAYGFRNYFEQYTCHSAVRDAGNMIVKFPDRIMKVAEWLTKRPGYSFRHFEYRNTRKFIDDLCTIYNTTWAYLREDFIPVKPEVLYELLDKLKPILDEEIIWFAYYNDKPIGFFILVPDLNQILRHFNGKLHLWNLIRFFYYKLTHEMKRMRAIVGGVMHSHQNTGVEAAIFYKLYQVFEKKPWFKELEIGWVGDYNPKMIATYESLGAKKVKTHITFRYMINDKLKFTRFKDEMAEKQKIKEENRLKSE